MTENIATMDLLSCYLKWQRYDSKSFLVHNDGGAFGQRIITESCLAALHQQLPGLIDALLVSAKDDDGIAVTSGGHIKNTLDYLQGVFVKITDASGETHFYDTVCNIYARASDSNDLVLGGYKCFTKEVNMRAGSVCVVKDVDWLDIDCSRNALEQQYPGCYTKWHTGKELGIDPYELTEVVFKSNAFVSTDLASIEQVIFD